MPRKFSRPRVLGPYFDKRAQRWRVVEVAGPGQRTDSLHKNEKIAEAYKKILETELGQPISDIEEAIVAYGKHQAKNGTKKESVLATEWRLRKFFPNTALGLEMLRPKTCQGYYDTLVDHYASASSHRNILAEARSLLRHCVNEGWLLRNPLDKVRGVGKRKKGKPQLRREEARKLYHYTLAEAQKRIPLKPKRDKRRAEEDRHRASAALCALVLGMRAKEIISRVGRDIDEQGRYLWIPDSKTDAGKRQIEVPDALASILHTRAQEVGAAGRLYPHRREWVLKSVKRLCAEADVHVVSAHGLRGTHSTMAQLAGMSAHLVAGTLGHESERVTIESYTDRAEREAMDRRASFAVLVGGQATLSKASEGAK